ncbi:hypothetical protein [Pectobacterium versatile]|uniref:hypothetical protein n=1 Tax=Pectobacterium versatile TaxID=2488639 RepID=UPI001CF5AFC6|nr:hypothetical protein [Pectobacterium versatile]UCP80358.1 hypothetical protein LGL95_15085 [Pectobacterium versatile]
MKNKFSKKEILELEKDFFLWDINYKGARFWDYMRSKMTEQYLPFSQRTVCFNFKDLWGFFLFISLFFRCKDCIFIVGRSELLDYSEQIKNEFNLDSPYLFVRQENNKIKGNSKFIEGFRWVFRILTHRFKKKVMKEIKDEIRRCSFISDNMTEDEISTTVRDFIGDVYFNIFLSKIIKGKVFYTNCVIPKVERSMQLLNSYEIQHGIVHDLHPDYYCIPMKYRFIAMNEITVNSLKEINFLGEVFKVDINYLEPDVKDRYDVIIFTTPCYDFSSEVERFILKFKGLGLNVKVQPHPKDKYNYSDSIDLIYGCKPSEGKVVILSDSTLIFQCINANKFFFLLNPMLKVSSITEGGIKEKYGEDARFSIIESLDNQLLDLEMKIIMK